MSISEHSTDGLVAIQRELRRLDRAYLADQVQLQEGYRRERDALLARLLLAIPRTDGTDDLISPGQAAHEFKIPKSVLYRLGDRYPLGEPQGFCLIDADGSRRYSRSGLRRHLEAHPLRRQRVMRAPREA